MAVEAVIMHAEGLAEVVLNGTVKQGQPVAHNGTNWVAAAATDAATNLYAQYLAMEGGISGQTIPVCRRCMLYDADAPYTANVPQYVSGTAGAITETRPATNGDVIQIIGQSIDTYRVAIEIKPPHEQEEFLISVYNYQNSAFEAPAVDDGVSEWVGTDVNAAAIGGVFQGRMPSGMIGAPLVAQLVTSSQATTAYDIDITYVAAYDEAANTGDAGATKTALTSSVTTADNKMHYVNVLTGMDADFAKAGINFGVEVDPDAGDFILIGLYMRYLVV